VGNVAGMLGVGTGVLSTLLSSPGSLAQMGGALVAGGAVGAAVSSRVGITELPQLVAAFHSFVGAAAVMTAWSSYLTHAPHLATDPAAIMVVSADWAAAVIGVSMLAAAPVRWGQRVSAVGGGALATPLSVSSVLPLHFPPA
jgi:H+-translocating NAD(P) transhydrogenase